MLIRKYPLITTLHPWENQSQLGSFHFQPERLAQMIT